MSNEEKKEQVATEHEEVVAAEGEAEVEVVEATDEAETVSVTEEVAMTEAEVGVSDEVEAVTTEVEEVVAGANEAEAVVTEEEIADSTAEAAATETDEVAEAVDPTVAAAAAVKTEPEQLRVSELSEWQAKITRYLKHFGAILKQPGGDVNIESPYYGFVTLGVYLTSYFVMIWGVMRLYIASVNRMFYGNSYRLQSVNLNELEAKATELNELYFKLIVMLILFVSVTLLAVWLIERFILHVEVDALYLINRYANYLGGLTLIAFFVGIMNRVDMLAMGVSIFLVVLSVVLLLTIPVLMLQEAARESQLRNKAMVFYAIMGYYALVFVLYYLLSPFWGM